LNALVVTRFPFANAFAGEGSEALFVVFTIDVVLVSLNQPLGRITFIPRDLLFHSGYISISLKQAAKQILAFVDMFCESCVLAFRVPAIK
jgi:hypothetical protein